MCRSENINKIPDEAGCSVGAPLGGTRQNYRPVVGDRRCVLVFMLFHMARAGNIRHCDVI